MALVFKGQMRGVKAVQRIRLRDPSPGVSVTADADATPGRRATGTEPFGSLLKPFDASA
jgi:hypothetical protein